MERIIALWPSMADLAADLRKPYSTVTAWKQRGSIPARFDLELIAAAGRRGVSLTLDQIAEARRTRFDSQEANEAVEASHRRIV